MKNQTIRLRCPVFRVKAWASQTVTVSVLAVVLLALMLANPARAQFVLTPVPGLPAVASGGVAWGDYDRDGRLDFLLSGAETFSLWRNTGNGFSNVTAAVAPGLPGLADGALAWGDLDNDGWLDFLATGLTNFSSPFAVSQIWRNTGSGFVPQVVPALPGVAESAVAWSDFDGDGKQDFLLTGTTNGNSSGAIAQVWRNQGDGFTNMPINGLVGVYFGSVAWGDFDNDGRPDFLLTGITNGAANEAISQLWRNTGTGFTNVPIPGLRGVFVSSVAWGDYDNDGRLDFLLQGLSANGFICELWHNTETGFTRVTLPGLPGLADGSLAWTDYDSDGRPDFLVTGLENGASRISQLWRNTGSGFTNIPLLDVPGNFDNALAWGDYDNDHRPDFLIAGTIAGGNVTQLWRNNSPASNAPPAAPQDLTATVSNGAVVLTWTAPSDDHTPGTGLSYNVRIGTAPGASDLVSASALANGFPLLPRMGNTRKTSVTFQRLQPGQIYYWSVQAVDAGLAASPFAPEQQFGNAPLRLEAARYAQGVFAFNFSSMPGIAFTALTATNATPPLSNWTVLGPVTEIAPGQFQFSDPQAAFQPQRFYRVRSP